MHKSIGVLALAMALFAGSAGAQTCGTIPNNLTNGTTADATQVMANFNYLINCIGGLRGYIGGLTMANDSTTPNTVIDTSAGLVSSDDNTIMMPLLTNWTKNTNAAWASGSGNGCLDLGSALAANTWYHLFIIANPTTAAVDEVCTASSAVPPSPTLPTGYTKKRRIGSFRTDSSAHILAFSQLGDEFLWKNAIYDVQGVTLNASSSRTLMGLTVPFAVQTQVIATVQDGWQSGAGVLVLTSPDQNDVANGGQSDLVAFTADVGARFIIRTNTSSQIGFRAPNNSLILYVNTLGWIDTRGRFN